MEMGVSVKRQVGVAELSSSARAKSPAVEGWMSQVQR